MSLRRYVNLVTVNHYEGIYSLRRLTGDSFFYPAKEAAAKARELPRLRRLPPDARAPWFDFDQKKKKKHAAALTDKQQQLEPAIRPQQPIFSILPTMCPLSHGEYSRLHSFPLSGTKILFADDGKRTTLYDTEARCAITTPCLHARKDIPVALSVPCPEPGPEAQGEQDQEDGESSSLYILDTALDPSNAAPFEALVWRDCECKAPDFDDAHKAWHCDALPRPPFFHQRPDMHTAVGSYAVVGNLICVSVSSVGTYCFDTVSREWSLAGDWQLPFSGKAEYDPDLKLWFGASAGNHQLPCAADLSPILRGRAPKKQQHYVWGLGDPHLPGDWLPDLIYPACMVSLGSGRFCIINFFRDMEGRSSSMDGPEVSDGIPVVVLSGLEVLAGNANGNDKYSSSDSDKDSCSGKGKGSGNGNGLRMIKHKSRLCNSNTLSIESVL